MTLNPELDLILTREINAPREGWYLSLIHI